ncbi:MAG: aldose 1-epimerase family protein [Candidatus Dormibacteraeota bacterium]|uniref:Aldose 1-epimerase family protein n=1 Tax=Candidatus Amunia macphersoniae TaxID=3127014 RepID=A0A934KM23_9BACT|nr:aldose 1-epimerase family protein [Candidatus Dormibacteraeota bacterium]
MAPSGEQIELVHGDQRLVVVGGGGGVRRYTLDGRDLLDGYEEHETCRGGRGQLLIPWPNRIRDGRYRFAEESHQLAITEPATGHAIHGLVRWGRWDVVDRTASSATMTHLLLANPGYPHTLALRADYALGDAGLTVTVGATNVGATPAPYGSGAHPYLRAALGTVDSCRLRVPAASRLIADERQIPVGREHVEGTEYDFREAREIGALKLDTAFADLVRDSDGLARVMVRDPRTQLALTLWMDAAHEYVMVFTGDTLTERRRHAVAIEPMTCPPNAFASGDQLHVLEPGEQHEARWGITPTLA